jgi:aldehyde dehydrogenase (NAD+)
METNIEAALGWLRRQAPRNLIGGAWRHPTGAQQRPMINPANGARLNSVQSSSEGDVDDAVDAARHAFESDAWRGLERQQRAERLRGLASLIRSHREELATLESLCCGKLFREAYHDDMAGAAEAFDYFAGWTNKLYGETCPVEGSSLNYTRYEPLGVCGLIVPWNWPLLMAAQKLAPALAMGNTVVIKPAPNTPLSLVRLLELAEEAALLPPGVVNIVQGGAAVGEALARHARVDKLSFTGSTATGRKVLRSSADSNLKPVTLELGGKSPAIVFDDAPDLDAAIRNAAEVAYGHKGENCAQPSRLLVHESLMEPVCEGLVSQAEARRCGDPFDPTSDQGPQATEGQMMRVLAYVDGARAAGATPLCGGQRDERGGNQRGYFVRPTVFRDIDNAMTIAQEEVFGPVLLVMPFRTEDEAVALANDSVYGLCAGLWSRDIGRAHRVAGRLDAGVVFINEYGLYDAASPFGGFKQSGWGHELGRHALMTYTRLKSVWVKL